MAYMLSHVSHASYGRMASRTGMALRFALHPLGIAASPAFGAVAMGAMLPPIPQTIGYRQ